MGDDEFERTALVQELVDTTEADLRAFNVDRFRGGETTLVDVLDAARTMPFGVPRRVVVVLDAQRLLEPKRENEATAQALDELERYLKHPLDSTVLVLALDALDRRTRRNKLLLEQATVVLCAGLSDDREAQRWLETQAREAGRRIDRDAVRLLVDRAGIDIVRLRSELERVLLFVGERKIITARDVEAVAGAARAHGEWAVTNALQAGNLETALRELALALDGGAIPVMVLGQLAWWVRSRLQPAPRVSAAVRALLDADVALKRSRDPRVVLERLIVEIGRTAPGWNPVRAGDERR